MSKYDYYYWPDIVSKEDIKDINDIVKINKQTQDKTSGASDAKKTSTVFLIKNKYLKDKLIAPMAALKNANRHNYDYNIYDLQDEDLLSFNIYEKNQEYELHRDGSPSNFVDIKLTGLINVSDEEYEGGDFSLLNSKEPTKIPLFNIPGTMIVFSSFILHKVNPILKGTRKTLTIFLKGPHLR